MRNKKGFTLIELVMVILLLGILAAVAIPRFWDLGDSADRASANGGIAGIKSGIAILNASIRVLGGNASYPTNYPGNPIEGNVVSDLYSTTNLGPGTLATDAACGANFPAGVWAVNSTTNTINIYYRWKGSAKYSRWTYTSVTGIVSPTPDSGFDGRACGT